MGRVGRANKLPTPFSQRGSKSGYRSKQGSGRARATPTNAITYVSPIPLHTLFPSSFTKLLGFSPPPPPLSASFPRTVKMIGIGSALACSDRSTHLAIHVHRHLLLSERRGWKPSLLLLLVVQPLLLLLIMVLLLPMRSRRSSLW